MVVLPVGPRLAEVTGSDMGAIPSATAAPLTDKRSLTVKLPMGDRMRAELLLVRLPWWSGRLVRWLGGRGLLLPRVLVVVVSRCRWTGKTAWRLISYYLRV